MHVLFIPSWFETPSRPTAGKAVKDLAIALSQQGISVNILFQSAEYLPELQITDELKIYHSQFRLKGKLWPIINYLALAKFKIVFEKYRINEGLPDLVHLHGYSSSVFAHYLKKEYKIPFVFTEHSSQIAESQLNYFAILQIKKYLKDCSKYFAVSDYLANKMKYLGKEINVIHNTIDFKKYIPVEKRKNHLIMINLLNENKQVEKGIEVFKIWNKNQTNSKLYIIGDGPERIKLEVKNSENITFIGEKKETEWLDILQSSACLLLMSKSETFGVVVLEALACHVPVLCLDNGGVYEIKSRSRDDLMLTVLPQSAPNDQIVNKLEQIINNYSLEAAKETRNTLKDYFDFIQIARKYLDVYKKILA